MRRPTSWPSSSGTAISCSASWASSSSTRPRSSKSSKPIYGLSGSVILDMLELRSTPWAGLIQWMWASGMRSYGGTSGPLPSCSSRGVFTWEDSSIKKRSQVRPTTYDRGSGRRRRRVGRKMSILYCISDLHSQHIYQEQ